MCAENTQKLCVPKITDHASANALHFITIQFENHGSKLITYRFLLCLHSGILIMHKVMGQQARLIDWKWKQERINGGAYNGGAGGTAMRERKREGGGWGREREVKR